MSNNYQHLYKRDIGEAPLCQCGCGNRVNRYKNTWPKYLKWHHIRSQPIHLKRTSIPRRTVEERFSSKASIVESGCHEWMAHRNKEGYGTFSLKGRQVLAHRFAFELHFGIKPGDKCVCHHCDNPSCVNPEHLFLGTFADNNHDRDRKGRTCRTSGEDRWVSKINWKIARQIRATYKEGFSVKETAKRVGVSKGLAEEVIYNRTWKEEDGYVARRATDLFPRVKEHEETIKKMFFDGVKTAQIATVIGFDHKTVEKFIRSQGWTRRKPRPAKDPSTGKFVRIQ